MCIENRQEPRFRDFARARINELNQLPGYLEDVSRTGCRVRFPVPFTLDTDREYLLTVLPATHSGLKEFDLVVQPQWIRNDQDDFEIGFNVLHSPGTREFHRYVETLAEIEAEELQEA